MPPPTNPPADTPNQSLQLEASRISFQGLFPEKLNLPTVGPFSAHSWNLSEYRPPTWLREGLTLSAFRGGNSSTGLFSPFRVDTSGMQVQNYTHYVQPQYPHLQSTLFPGWWAVSPRHDSAGDPPVHSPQPIPYVPPMKPQSFRAYLEERVNTAWAKEKIDQDPVLSKLPKAVIDQIRDGLPTFMIDVLIKGRAENMADFYLDQLRITDPSAAGAVRKLIDAGTKYLLEGARWQPPVGPYVPIPDSNIPKTPGYEGTIEWYTKYSISFELWADFSVKKTSFKPFSF